MTWSRGWMRNLHWWWWGSWMDEADEDDDDAANPVIYCLSTNWEHNRSTINGGNYRPTKLGHFKPTLILHEVFIFFSWKDQMKNLQINLLNSRPSLQPRGSGKLYLPKPWKNTWKAFPHLCGRGPWKTMQNHENHLKSISTPLWKGSWHIALPKSKKSPPPKLTWVQRTHSSKSSKRHNSDKLKITLACILTLAWHNPEM